MRNIDHFLSLQGINGKDGLPGAQVWKILLKINVLMQNYIQITCQSSWSSSLMRNLGTQWFLVLTFVFQGIMGKPGERGPKGERVCTFLLWLLFKSVSATAPSFELHSYGRRPPRNLRIWKGWGICDPRSSPGIKWDHSGKQDQGVWQIPLPGSPLFTTKSGLLFQFGKLLSASCLRHLSLR